MKKLRKKKTSTAQKVPRNYYSYGSALLAATALIEKIEPYCQSKPLITGDLAERKAAVRRIEIACTPETYQAETGQLLPENKNKVIETLSERYEIKELPEGKGPGEGSISINYMTIPVTIHFK